MSNDFTFEKSKESNVMKTVRFPESLYNDIDKLIQQANGNKKTKEYSFNGFVVSACKYAMENLKK